MLIESQHFREPPVMTRHFTRTCFLVLIATGACFLLVAAFDPALRWIHREFGPQRRSYLGRSMAQWLQILALKTNAPGDPLQIVQIRCSRTSDVATAEVQLSYDALSKYGFTDVRYSKFGVSINGDNLSSACWRATNGGCLMPFDQSQLRLGTNQVQVTFIISNRTNTDFIEATGPARELVWTNGAGQGP